ncbi:nucleotide exchange factor GrpE [Sphaerisporangium corydalis]|uniref:Protein GrpE n=1 Tax=Sphaerisporangium corydalis TaxID=1441875 RepID=A0ABV9EU70_9ACTN|nr:nucleotide exchange factor GrpE [Sphaerisporangium corydalis]
MSGRSEVPHPGPEPVVRPAGVVDGTGTKPVTGDDSERPDGGGGHPGVDGGEQPVVDGGGEPGGGGEDGGRELSEMRDRWLRAVAELDNVRKRMARDADRQRLDERARVAAEWLPVIDNLELALKHAGADAGAVIEGVRAVRDQAVAVLAHLGFPRRDDVGTRFDPSRHEAVSTAPDPDADPGTVLEVVRPGYGDDGPRQLRPASVVVSTRAGE